MPCRLPYLLRTLLAALIALAGAVASRPAAAAPTAVPVLIPVVGILTSNGGGPVADGKYVLVLKVYDGPDAAAQTLFSQVELAVAVSQGSFAVTLGKASIGGGQLTAEMLADHGSTWLGMAVGSEPELPRVPMLPVPYALRAVRADQAATALQADKAQTALQADTAQAAVTAQTANKALSASFAEEAQSAVLSNQAKGLQCTGCVGAQQLDPALLVAQSHPATWQGQKSNVQAALDATDGRLQAFEQVVHVENGKVGIGVAQPKCAVDLAGLCIQGQGGQLVVPVADEAAMQAIQSPGSVVYRNDQQKFWGRTQSKWRQLAFVTECGDGMVDGAEACDDGNLVDTDACVACQKAKCGDGKVYQGVEACDDGAANSDTQPNACRVTCVKAKCGDKVIDAGEQCDDGNAVSGDGCSAICASEKVTFKGYAAWSQDVNAQSNAQQDAAMDSACKGIWAGSRAATVAEIIAKMIVGMPGNNNSGQHLLGKCPQCGGNASGSAVDKQCRVCVDPGANFPVAVPAGWNLNCCNSTRTAMCVQ